VTFAPGDVVVCVSTVTPCCNYDIASHVTDDDLPELKLRSTYRVGRVANAKCGCGQGGIVSFQPSGVVGHNYAWPQACFRKVEPAKEDIFKLASAPVREGELV
jgi:hypothetical protein